MLPESGATLNLQVAQLHMDRFNGVPNAVYADPEHINGTAVVMAALLQEGSVERFQGVVQDLASNPMYQGFALAGALPYCQGEMLSPIFAAIDTIKPESLPVEARVSLMAALSQVAPSEHDQAVTMPWAQYSVRADELFDQVTGQSWVGPSSVTALFQAGRFSELTDTATYAGYQTALTEQFVHSEAGQRVMEIEDERISVGEMVALGALQALHALELPAYEQRLLSSLAQSSRFSLIVVGHVEALLRSDDPVGVSLYHSVRPHRNDLAHMELLDAEHAEYMARHGDIEVALSSAESLPLYGQKVRIMLAAARYLGAHGEAERAALLLDRAAALDPLTIEPHQSDTDEDEASYIKSTFDLKGERTFALGVIAESAIAIKGVAAVLDSYTQGSYPISLESMLAQSAADEGRTDEYVRRILENTALTAAARLRLLGEALDTFHRRATRFSDGPEMQTVEQSAQTLARNFVDRHIMELQASRDLDSQAMPLAHLLVQCGVYDQAMSMAQGKGIYDVSTVVAGAIQHLADSGQTAEAWALYIDSPNRPTESMLRDSTLRYIILNGILKGDFDSARVALLEIPDYSQATVMNWVLREIGNEVVDAPAWVLRFAAKPEKYGVSITEVAAAIQRAGILKERTLQD